MESLAAARNGPNGLTRQQFVTLIHQLYSDYYPSPVDGDDPPDPLDPIISSVVRRLLLRSRGVTLHPAEPDPNFPPRPPWVESLLGILDWNAAALNPQPLPPGGVLAVTLADELIQRTTRLHEIAESLQLQNDTRSSTGATSRLLAHIDELCGNRPLKLPRPKREPPPGWKTELDSMDFVLMSLQFNDASGRVHSAALRRAYLDAAASLVEAAWRKLRPADAL